MANGWLQPVRFRAYPSFFSHYISVISIFIFNYTAADSTVKIWHALDGRFERTLEGHSEGISDIAWSHDSQYLCSASDDKTIRIWNVFTVCLMNSGSHVMLLFVGRYG